MPVRSADAYAGTRSPRVTGVLTCALPILKELITRKQHPAPKFWLNPEIKDFYQFTPDDIKVTDYVTGPQIKNIPVAI